MTSGTTGFVAERLNQAREARGLSLTNLAELIQISKSSISHYEAGTHTPSPDILNTISEKLNLSLNFFLKANPILNDSSRIFYRSMSSATKNARRRAERRFEWLKEIVKYLKEFIDFPQLNLPKFDVPEDFRKISTNMIESYAQQLRDYWSLGYGPIDNVIRTLESNGIFVSYGSLDAETLDAFSELNSDETFIFLNSDKNILVRSRFDACHELGHYILHSKVEKSALNKAIDFTILEKQAHHFSAAFLLPEKSFVDELWGVSLDSFRSLKPRWKISIAAMISRAQQLELIDENEIKRLWINRNRRNWREYEPLDDLAVEIPKMLSNSFTLLIENKIKTKEQIINDLALAPKDIEELINLKRGFFSDYIDDFNGLKIKEKNNIIQFKRIN